MPTHGARNAATVADLAGRVSAGGGWGGRGKLCFVARALLQTFAMCACVWLWTRTIVAGDIFGLPVHIHVASCGALWRWGRPAIQIAVTEIPSSTLCKRVKGGVQGATVVVSDLKKRIRKWRFGASKRQFSRCAGPCMAGADPPHPHV